MRTPSPKRAVLEYAAFDMIERGFSIVPISPETKKPFVKWKAFQSTIPTEDDIAEWQRLASEKGFNPDDIKLAVITGELSGFIVVDCDNQDAVNFCRSCGVWSPIRARTKNGIHLYFKHKQDRQYRPRVGSKSKGIDWPRFNGLDLRGDGSYAVCPPSEFYEWEFDTDIGLDELEEWPEWQGWPRHNSPAEFFEDNSEQIELQRSTGIADGPDLSQVELIDYRSEWQKTLEFVEQKFPTTGKIPSDCGNGRNIRVLQYASEQLRTGAWGNKLNERVCEFMDFFFEERLELDAWRATCRSVEQMEKQNHPERFDEAGNYIPPIFSSDGIDLLQDEDPSIDEIEEVIEEIDPDFLDFASVFDKVKDYKVDYLVTPFIRRNAIHHISGYTGQGKSTLVQWLTHACAAGRRRVGPFSIPKRYKTLYLNYEEGKVTIRMRIKANEQIIGPFRPEHVDNVLLFHTSMAKDTTMYLNDPHGRSRLFKTLKKFRPDLLVIDTIRSAYPGLDENDATAWAEINQLLLALRNRDISVIMIHHSNKPNERGLGSYAGSTNQLTQVELQYTTALLYEKEEDAKAKGGVHDKSTDDNPSYHDILYADLPGGRADNKITMLMRITSNKDRDKGDKYEPNYHIARVIDLIRGDEFIHYIPTKHDRFIDLYTNNASIPEMISTLGKSSVELQEWIDEYEKKTKT